MVLLNISSIVMRHTGWFITTEKLKAVVINSPLPFLISQEIDLYSLHLQPISAASSSAYFTQNVKCKGKS